MERLLVVTTLLLATQVTVIAATGTITGWGLMFFLLHNQAYYRGRHLIDSQQPWSWTYSSQTSTAKFKFNFRTRLLLFLLGLTVVIGTYILWV